MLFGPLTQAIVTELAPRNARATYMAAFAVVGDLKDTAGPAIGTYLYADRGGPPRWLIGSAGRARRGRSAGVRGARHEAPLR